jgi:hypothetical protein
MCVMMCDLFNKELKDRAGRELLRIYCAFCSSFNTRSVICRFALVSASAGSILSAAAKERAAPASGKVPTLSQDDSQAVVRCRVLWVCGDGGAAGSLSTGHVPELG